MYSICLGNPSVLASGYLFLLIPALLVTSKYKTRDHNNLIGILGVENESQVNPAGGRIN